jgi:hypothetical protein
MKNRTKAGLALAATIALAGSAGVATAATGTTSPGCVYTGGGWACYGTLPPNHPTNPTPDTPPAPEGQVLVSTTERVAGADRFETAAAISRVAFPDGAAVVYIANGVTGGVDALAGASLVSDGPILFVTATGVPAATAVEVDRLAPSRVVVLGGAGAVSDVVAGELAAIAAP